VSDSESVRHRKASDSESVRLGKRPPRRHQVRLRGKRPTDAQNNLATSRRLGGRFPSRTDSGSNTFMFTRKVSDSESVRLGKRPTRKASDSVCGGNVIKEQTFGVYQKNHLDEIILLLFLPPLMCDCH
jgi:hypothetical protein